MVDPSADTKADKYRDGVGHNVAPVIEVVVMRAEEPCAVQRCRCHKRYRQANERIGDEQAADALGVGPVVFHRRLAAMGHVSRTRPTDD